MNLVPATSREGMDEKVARAFSYEATGNLCPMTSFIGGVAAQVCFHFIIFINRVNHFVF
jgi:ubiquitin-activating enzyme E1